MAPKKKTGVTGSIKAAPKANFMNEIDDLIGESELPAGEASRALSAELHTKKTKDINEKYYTENSPMQMGRNAFALNNIRILCTLFIGTATGIYGFDGPSGIAFYVVADFLIGIMIYAMMGFKAQPYFASV
jgi:hypothetical protein